MDNNIILIGMPGSGKSSVGVVLAKALGYGFVDVDLLIQERAGALLQEILDRDGVERFLDLERDVLCSVDCARSVIAPGGSCVCGRRPSPICGNWARWSIWLCPSRTWKAASTTWPPGHRPVPRPDHRGRLRLPHPPL